MHQDSLENSQNQDPWAKVRAFTTRQACRNSYWTQGGGSPVCWAPMRLALTAVLFLAAARVSAQESAGEAQESVGEGDAPEEAESRMAQPIGPDLLYTRELTDDELARKLREDLPSLGSISIGFADRGRVLNAVQMPEDPAWIVERPAYAFATRETVDSLALAFRSVRKRFPDSPPARLSHMGTKDGGYLRPHRSHQSGRDADVGLFYRGDRFPPRGAPRERLIDPARNWALIRALIAETDVQLILVDQGIQDVLRKHALAIGEDPRWLSQVFGGLVKHARRHRDHFHVRFYAPRAQELGRRIQPLLALRPDQNRTLHVVRTGNTLTQIATKYKTSVASVRKANGLQARSLLKLGQHLLVPLRGTCTNCPLPPPVAVPPRFAPPEPLPSVESWLGGINPEMATAE
jgi:murein endopeptidase